MAQSNVPLLTAFALLLFSGLVSASPSPLADPQNVSSPPVTGNWPSSSGTSGSGDWSGSAGAGGSGNWSGSAGGADSWWNIPGNLDAVRVAHVVLGSIAVLLILPGGAVFVRLFGEKLKHGVWAHGGIQIFGYLVYCTAAGLGIWMAKTFALVGGGPDAYTGPKLYHPIIGMIVLGLLFFQPFTELANHILSKRWYAAHGDPHPKSFLLGTIHIWWGRLLLLLGIVNGGLGFAFADQIPENNWSMAPRIAYGVIATVVVFVYVVVMVIWGKQNGGRNMSQVSNTVRDEEMQGLSQPQPISWGMTGPAPGVDGRPQTAQTAQSESTTSGNFKSTAL